MISSDLWREIAIAAFLTYTIYIQVTSRAMAIRCGGRDIELDRSIIRGFRRRALQTATPNTLLRPARAPECMPEMLLRPARNESGDVGRLLRARDADDR